MRDSFLTTTDKAIIPDSVHGRSLPYPIRTFIDEENAFIYFLARYRNVIKTYENSVSSDELWSIKAELLAIIHSFSTPHEQPEVGAQECVAMIDVLFCQICPESRQITKPRRDSGLNYSIRY